MNEEAAFFHEKLMSLNIVLVWHLSGNRKAGGTLKKSESDANIKKLRARGK